MVAGAFLLGWFVLTLVGACATAVWSRRTWKRRKELPPPLQIVALVVAISAMGGALGTLVGLIKVFGGVGGESSDPSQKARILASGIAEAMNWTALGLLVWIPSAIALAFLTRKYRAPTIKR